MYTPAGLRLVFSGIFSIASARMCERLHLSQLMLPLVQTPAAWGSSALRGEVRLRGHPDEVRDTVTSCTRRARAVRDGACARRVAADVGQADSGQSAQVDAAQVEQSRGSEATQSGAALAKSGAVQAGPTQPAEPSAAESSAQSGEASLDLVPQGTHARCHGERPGVHRC